MSTKFTKENFLVSRGILIAIQGEKDKNEEVDENRQENENVI